MLAGLNLKTMKHPQFYTIQNDPGRNWIISGLIIIFLAILGMAASAQGRIPETVIHHKSYTVYFQPNTKCPDSVSWNLTIGMFTCPKVTRVDRFAKDPANHDSPTPAMFVQLPGYAKDKTLELSKGHLFSYEDAMCDPINNKECFYVDQMYSQYQQFNAGDWRTVEAYERQLATTQSIHVIAGYIGIAQTLLTGIPIVSYMYKAILHGGHYECWIMPNLPTTKGHGASYWHVGVVELNSKTGLHLR